MHHLPDGKPIFQACSPEPIIGSFVLQLLAGRGDVWHTVGTATLLRPGMALTARHVFEQCARIYPVQEVAGSKGHAEVDMFGLQYLPGGEVRQWKVHEVAMSLDADLAVLRMAGSPDWFNHPSVRLTLDPPQIGSKIAAFGYAGAAQLATPDIVQVTPNSYTTAGVVREVHLIRRDQKMGPSFHANVRLDDSMSGAPAFNDQGVLCGIGSTTFPPFEAGDEHATFFTLLWPMMVMEIDWPWEARPVGTKYRLLDLFHSDPSVLGLSRITISPDGATVAVKG